MAGVLRTATLLAAILNQRLVSVFCIPPTFNPTLDAAGDVPGPGGAAFNGEIELCASGTSCPAP